MKTSTLFLLVVVVATSFACSHERPLREGLVVPAVDATRLSAAPLPEVDERKSPPRWLDHEREDGDALYGVGVVKGRGNRDVDLYRVQEAAEASVAEWLRDRGMRTTPPRNLVPPLDVELRAIFIEKLAHNKKSDLWYCLARLDREAEADYAKDRWKEVNERLDEARDGLEADTAEERVVAGLTILFELDRRAQYRVQYRTLTGKDLDPPRRLTDHRIESAAREALAAYGVRVNITGEPVAGLREAVEGTLQRVSLLPSVDGAGKVDVRLNRRAASTDGRPFVYLEGELRVRLEGPAGPAHVVPLRAKGSGTDWQEADAEAARRGKDALRDALIQTLEDIGQG
ncbi:MAG: hypothetical protein PVF51_12015 [Nitrospirota bacterium]|jgi:hypothetical protein